ncbi:GNAT family N-acetyltransferase [Lentzea sp. NPDC058450]|uniref:GNAT family N-acetyltransferase n=1 Tax=Lentzea sp. NPDC058450 TaxID=3346505 RepID=UPI00364D451B
MHIREARAEDAPAIHRINREALAYDFPLADTQAQLDRIIKAPNIKLLVAEDVDVVCGYIQLSDYENTYHRPLKNLITLATAPAHQGRGVGRALLAAGEE